jgi:hypothetical protein
VITRVSRLHRAHVMRRLAFFAFAVACTLIAARPVPARAQSIERIWSSANEAYFHGDVAQAALQYQRLVDAGVHDPDVYFNLGVAEGRQGHLGKAALYFERSLWLRPGDETAEHELAAARGTLARGQAEREGEATVQARPPLIEALVRPLSADFLAGAVLLFDILLFALLLARRFSRNEPLRLGLAIAWPLCALLLIAAGIGLAVKNDTFREGGAAVVLREGAELREGPDAAAQVRAAAHEGDSARMSRRESGFVHVQLSGGARGWINSKDIGTVRPD